VVLDANAEQVASFLQPAGGGDIFAMLMNDQNMFNSNYAKALL
jgi:hypothetical protein